MAGVKDFCDPPALERAICEGKWIKLRAEKIKRDAKCFPRREISQGKHLAMSKGPDTSLAEHSGQRSFDRCGCAFVGIAEHVRVDIQCHRRIAVADAAADCYDVEASGEAQNHMRSWRT